MEKEAAVESSDRTEAIEAVRKLLVDGDSLDRRTACRILGDLANPGDALLLVAALRDADINVCVEAAQALGRIGDCAVIAPLLETLYTNPSGEVKIAVLEALISLGGKRVVPHLMGLVKNRPDDMVFEEGDTRDSWLGIQRIAVEALGRMGASEAVPVLVAILEEYQGGEDAEAEVLTALARIGGASEAELIKRLTAGTARERQCAAHALGKASSAAGLHALAGALGDGEDDVRAAAIEALALRRAGRYTAAILALIKDPVPYVRRAALRAVADLADVAEVNGDELIALIGDDNPQVRAAKPRRRTRLNNGDLG